MDVFVIEKGCKYEGGGVVAVTSNLEAAQVIAKENMDAYTAQVKKWREKRGEDSVTIESDWGVWEFTSDPNNPKFWLWEESTEFVSIRLMTVVEQYSISSNEI